MSLKLTFLFFLCSFNCFSQDIKVSGRVLDSHNLPISYANVILENTKDRSKTFGTITNSNGHFLVKKIISGTYNLEISFVGYSGYSTQIVIDTIMDLKPVVLKEISEAELNVIEVIIDDNNN